MIKVTNLPDKLSNLEILKVEEQAMGTWYTYIWALIF